MAPYLQPAQRVPVGRGRTINLVCLGQGSPTVILTAGLGSWSFNWGLVQPVLAKRTRVCAWDRAGSGFSSPSPEPQDTLHTTADLERALTGAGIEGPYVMVGHSLGAFESLRFTDLHRDSVVGMVLLDPDIPDRNATEDRTAPKFAAVSRAMQEATVKQQQDCAASLRDGSVKSGTARFEQCTAPPVPPSLARLKQAIGRLNADPARLRTQAALEQDHARGTSSLQMVKPGRRYGDLPLIVLTAGRDVDSVMSALPQGAAGAGTPADIAELRADLERFLRDGWIPAHRAYAALSTRGRQQFVADSGHNIPVQKPDVVIAAIEEVLAVGRR